MVTTFPFVLAVMMRFFFVFGSEAREFSFQGILLFHRGENGFSVQLRPGRGDDRRGGIAFFEKSDAGGELIFGNAVRMRENDAAGVFHLIVKKFAKILHIQSAFACVHHRAEGVEGRLLQICVGDSLDDVAELADAGRLDNDSVGMIFRRYFFEGFGKIAYEGTADTPRIHFGDIDARILQKTAVDADFPEFVFD